jgi:cysteinyl-tRNA synthetase
MKEKLFIYNSYSRKKEEFKAIHPPHAGMYVCGPTVYGDPHPGHARAAIVFDMLYRYLKHLGYSVRYVRNITDVGHLENDSDDGEDKILKKARLEQLEPMEVVQYYTNSYHYALQKLNCLPPSIEPHASGHIIEQIELIKKLLEKGYAYQSADNIYFDLLKYINTHEYGKLSGKIPEDLINSSRELKGQDDKRNPIDFALWKKGSSRHIMKWKSPWNEGFPGWHLECSAMSAKYLGVPFDIHGGGLDLMFPHHESEIAQSSVAYNKMPCNYWIHNNMITINGQKMAKSLGNSISLEELFKGKSALLEKAYSPMVTRFFILQAHYRSTIDFSNQALLAAEKGFSRLCDAYTMIASLKENKTSSLDIQAWIRKCYDALNDDLNSARLIAELFEGSKFIKHILEGKAGLNKEDLKQFTEAFSLFFEDILGLQCEVSGKASDQDREDALIRLLLDMRQKARENKDFESSDRIRDELNNLGISIKDSREGSTWVKE